MLKLRGAANVSFVGLLISISLLIGVGALFRYDVRNAHENDAWVDHTHDVIETLDQLLLKMSEAETWMRGYASLRDPAYYERFSEAVEQMRVVEQDALRIVGDNAQQRERLRLIGPKLTRRMEFLYERGVRARNGLPDITRPEAVSLSLQIRDDVGRMKAIERRLLRERIARENAARERMFITGAMGIAAAIGFVVLVFFVLRKEARDRQKAEREARRNSDLLQKIADSTTDGIYVKDERGRYMFMNEACAKYVGRPSSEVVGLTDHDLFADVEYARYITDCDTLVLRSKHAHTFEDKSPGPNGSEIIFLTNKVPLFDESGVVKGLVGVSREITALKAAEAARLRESTVLLETGEWFQSSRSLEDAYDVVRQMGSNLFPRTDGALLLFPPSRGDVELKASWGAPTTTIAATIAADDCWALRRGQLHVFDASDSSMRCPHVAPSFEGACACVPLLAHGELLGVLHLSTPQQIDEASTRMALAFGEQLSMAIGNLNLRETLRAQSIRDPLTGLFNRRYMDEAFERELKRIGRDGGSMSLLLLDIDHFKRFNDTHGHAAGDEVLRAVGRLLTERTRSSDVAARLGGEELAMLLPGAKLEDARAKAESIRAAIAALALKHESTSLGQVTVSIGVAEFPTHGANSIDLVRVADAALYAAKHGGRNRVEVASQA